MNRTVCSDLGRLVAMVAVIGLGLSGLNGGCASYAEHNPSPLPPPEQDDEEPASPAGPAVPQEQGCAADADADGLCDDEEATHGTDPALSDTDGDGLSDFVEVFLGTDPLVQDTDGDLLLDGEEILLGSDPLVPDAACASSSAQALLVKKPVDIIVGIDGSGSMNDEIEAVEKNVNENFATIIGGSDIDYRIILVAEYPRVCVGKPLSNDDCSDSGSGVPQAGPAFLHYPHPIGSHDAFDILADTYDQPDPDGLAPGGWGAWLRQEASKVFLLFSDDEPRKEALWFDNQLTTRAPEHFGTPAARNYTWHSIIGMAPNEPPETPWLPGDPVQNDKCDPGSVSPAQEYQELSKLTGGLRFPLCDYEGFDVVFQAIAQGVIEQVSLPCTYQAPPPPDQEIIDMHRVAVVYTPGETAAPRRLERVADQGSCKQDAFYVQDETIVLCDQTCALVEADTGGSLVLHFGCEQLDW